MPTMTGGSWWVSLAPWGCAAYTFLCLKQEFIFIASSYCWGSTRQKSQGWESGRWAGYLCAGRLPEWVRGVLGGQERMWHRLWKPRLFYLWNSQIASQFDARERKCFLCCFHFSIPLYLLKDTFYRARKHLILSLFWFSIMGSKSFFFLRSHWQLYPIFNHPNTFLKQEH